MAHTQENQEKLVQRIRRIRGQLNAVETALTNDQECTVVLHSLAACRGAINSLMAEVLEGHIRFHVVGPQQKPTKRQMAAAEDVINVVKSYLK